MKYTVLVLCALLLQACGKTASDKLMTDLYQGKKSPDKGVIIGNISFIDQYTPSERTSITLCFNKTGELSDKLKDYRCGTSIDVRSTDGKEAAIRKWRAASLDRRQLSLDAIIYNYPDKKNSNTNYTTYFFLNPPPIQQLPDYGSTGYIGQLDIAISVNRETEKPALGMRFVDDYAGFQQSVAAMQASGQLKADNNLRQAVSVPITGITPELTYTSKTTGTTITTQTIYIPQYRYK